MVGQGDVMAEGQNPLLPALKMEEEGHKPRNAVASESRVRP